MCALIPAAGRGARFGATENKIFAPLLGRPLIGWTLGAFAASAAVDAIVVIGSDGELERLQALGETYGGGKLRAVIGGGATRQESVRRGLDATDAETVLIHDAARCCVTPKIVEAVAQAARTHGAATAAVPVTDTLVRDDGASVDRTALWAVQTPQGFDRIAITAAHARAVADGYEATDDAGISGRFGPRATLVPGSVENLKVTRPEDLALAEAILRQRQTPQTPPIAIGHGYDVHALVAGRPLWLGGVHFPDSPVGLLGHSDADALLHALSDALLGAAGLGDIGVHFPPSDHRHKDRPSIEFVHEVKALLDAAGWRVGNVDISVLAEAPKIGPRAAQMRQIIARTLAVAPEQVNIKATTNERMGFVGRGEGIAVHATALLIR